MRQYLFWILFALADLFAMVVIYQLLVVKIGRIEKPCNNEESGSGQQVSPYPVVGDESEEGTELHDYSAIDDYKYVSHRFVILLKEKKLYLDPDLKMQSVADMLHTNRTYLSKAINSVYEMNFNSIVNRERIREATAMFAENPDMKITELCSKSGFKSMATFNSAFSRTTGKTPAEWCKNYKSKNSRNVEVDEAYQEKAQQEDSR